MVLPSSRFLRCLTERERSVAALLMEGKSDKEIATDLSISVHTIRFHLTNIFRKLDVTGRMDLVIQLLKS